MVKFLHGFVVDRIHGIACVTFCASVPEAAVDFEHGMRFFVVAVEEITTDAFLAAVACMLDIDISNSLIIHEQISESTRPNSSHD